MTDDPTQREKTFAERGLDFEDALIIFAGPTVDLEDPRKDYGKRRNICYGLLEGRLVVVGYTLLGALRLVFNMRRANDREQTRLASYIGV